jgi:hypothetical protein
MDMSFLYSERIVTISDGQLQERDGRLELDGASCISEVDSLPIGPLIDVEAVLDSATELGPEHGPLHITSGLERDDFLVFLGRRTIGSSPALPPLPYFVTETGSDNEGTGIVVAVDLASTQPVLWLSDHTMQLAHQLKPDLLKSLMGMFGPRLLRFIESQKLDV